MDDAGDKVDAQEYHCLVAVHSVSWTFKRADERQLALVVLLHTDTWHSRRGMIEYNLTFLRQGVRRILLEV